MYDDVLLMFMTSWKRMLTKELYSVPTYPRGSHSIDCMLTAIGLSSSSFHYIISLQALERYRKTGAAVKCKRCVARVEAAEREAAAAKRVAAAANEVTGSTAETLKCAGKCQKTLPLSAFNKSQIGKGEGKARCRSCVEAAVAAEALASQTSKQDKLEAARTSVAEAKKKGNAKEILKAESELAALQAEHVTGLKPVRLGKGRGKGGRWGGTSSGRGRGRGAGRGVKK